MTIFEIDILWFTLAPSYYGLMYVLGFLYGVYYLKKFSLYTVKQQEDLFLYVFLWVVLWGRLWYVLFYNLSAYLSDPLSILRVWDGWMSFHGWFLWVVAALYIFSRRNKLEFWSLSDTIAMIIPIWLFFGRIGNYINKELLGFEYSWPLAVVTSLGSYFPSPLMEALLEWAVMFIIFHYILKKPSFTGQFAALFLILYGTFRTFVEICIRTPDPQIGYYFWFLTQWSLLSIPMILAWALIYKKLSK